MAFRNAQAAASEIKLQKGFIAVIFCCPESGRSVAWLARLFRVQEVVSSNLTAPTIFSKGRCCRAIHGRLEL